MTDAPITHEIQGRQLKLRQPTETQQVLMRRTQRIANGLGDKIKGIDTEKVTPEMENLWLQLLDVTGEALDTISGLVVDEADRMFLEQQLRLGNVEIKDIIAIAQVLEAAHRTAPANGPAPKRARRG